MLVVLGLLAAVGVRQFTAYSDKPTVPLTADVPNRPERAGVGHEQSSSLIITEGIRLDETPVVQRSHANADQQVSSPEGLLSVQESPNDNLAWISPEEFRLIRRSTIELERSPRLITYTVRPGDSMWSIAARFHLDVDTLRWSNPKLESNPDMLYPGQQLIILPEPGVYHTVRSGETLESIGRKYGVAPELIRDYPLNRLKPPYTLQPGQKLVVPGGRKQLHCPKPGFAPGSLFAWPVAGQITQKFKPGHRALDIGAPYGCPVYAARDGVVVYADFDPSGWLGFTVAISHGDGWRTSYSHLSGPWVQVGQRVARGEMIGRLGSTGNSTGPHVHFVIRKNGVPKNPLDYLPSNP